MKKFEAQSGLQFKACSGLNLNKESDTGVLNVNGNLNIYKITWRQMYNCSRGNKPRHNKSRSVDSTAGKPRNAPGSRLMDCKATLNVRVLRLDSGEEIMQVPLLLTRTTRSIH